jgi:hypothetical protein
MFQKEVRCFNYRELMADALCYMRDHEYSQIVVRWRGNVRLLSGEGIVKWITDLLDHGEDHIARRAVGEAVPFEKPDTFLVMGADAPVSEVRAAFRADQDRLKIAAVIITDDGTGYGKPIGFADPWDMLLTYSHDFRSIRWRGRSFKLSKRQADVVRLLYRAYENGIPEMSDRVICAELQTPGSRLRDTFRKSKAWGTLILKGSRPGMHRLNL